VDAKGKMAPNVNTFVKGGEKKKPLGLLPRGRKIGRACCGSMQKKGEGRPGLSLGEKKKKNPTRLSQKKKKKKEKRRCFLIDDACKKKKIGSRLSGSEGEKKDGPW